ncbi:hypothetical protein [Pseudomonas shirazensis]|uniref:hypothetical protein n=1 Tax=Pseudomonas shirazensis TaxID=2745494 RepID=UPI003988804D
MAETIGPFNLGLSVNFSPPLGAALDALRISIDLLRKQINTMRLGLIIGAWTGVRPVLEPGHLTGNSTEPNHLQGPGAQRLTLAPVNDQLGRLHQNLTRLDQVISGLIWVKRQDQPAQWRAPLKYPIGTSASPVPEQRSAEGAPNLETPKVSGSFSPPLGAALEALRISIDLLRKQMNTTRLGLILGAWTGVRPVLEPGHLIGNSTEPNHLQGPGAQRLTLAPVNDQLGRLHQNLTRLDQVISGLIWVKRQDQPAQWRAPLKYPLGTSASPVPEQRFAAGTEHLVTLKGEDAEKAGSQAAPAAGANNKAGMLATLAAAATILASASYKVSQQASASGRLRAFKAVSDVFGAGVVGATLTGGKALVTGEDGKEKVEGVAAAAGGLGGMLTATALANAFSRNKRLQRYAPVIGGFVGDILGGLAGGKLHDFFQDEPKPTASNASSVAQAGEAGSAPSSAGSGQPEQQTRDKRIESDAPSSTVEFIGIGRSFNPAAATVFPLPPVNGWSAASLAPSYIQAGAASFSSAEPDLLRTGSAKVGSSSPLLQPRKAWKGIPGLTLLDTTLQLAETYSSDATTNQKIEGYGTALGGLSGGLAGAAAGAAIGSVVPVIGTAIGGLVGGVLGSMGGEQIGGWLARLVTSEAPPTEQFAAQRESAPEASPEDTCQALAECAKQPSLPADPSPTVPAAPIPTINQQFTFTANMPVTFNNSPYDPSTLHQLEAIARGQLEELMRQARAVQMFETPHVSI